MILGHFARSLLLHFDLRRLQVTVLFTPFASQQCSFSLHHTGRDRQPGSAEGQQQQRRRHITPPPHRAAPAAEQDGCRSSSTQRCEQCQCFRPQQLRGGVRVCCHQPYSGVCGVRLCSHLVIRSNLCSLSLSLFHHCSLTRFLPHRTQRTVTWRS